MNQEIGYEKNAVDSRGVTVKKVLVFTDTFHIYLRT